MRMCAGPGVGHVLKPGTRPPSTLQEPCGWPIQTWIIKNYAWSCISTFIQLALFPEECDRLKLVFSRLKYPDNLVNSTISRFVAARASDQPVSSPAISCYKFQCDLCDAGYVGFTRCHLYQRVEEDKNSSSSIGKHFRDKHSLALKDLTKNFSVLMKCTNKFDCLVIFTQLFEKFSRL